MDLDDIPTLDLDSPDGLSKAGPRGGRYYRRVPTGNPKRPWRYYYTREEYEREHGDASHVNGHEVAQDRERAKSGEVKLSKKELHHRLKHGTYSIISAGRNPAHPDEGHLDPDDPKFAKRHEELRRELQKRGMKYTEVEGHYGGKEKSFLVYHHEQPERRPDAFGGARVSERAMMVHHDSPSHFSTIRELGKKFNQDSVIHSHAGKHEMHYTVGPNAGKHHKGEGHKVVPHAEDFYTHAPTKRSATKFSLNFDFDNYHAHEDALHKSQRFVITRDAMLKSGSHKYISRTPNRSGGYTYVYAHPESGEHVHIETKHKSAARNSAGARTESHAGGKHVGIMLTHTESKYHDKGGKTEHRVHDSLSPAERSLHEHALRDTHDAKTAQAAEKEKKPAKRHEVSVSSQERYRVAGGGTGTTFLIRDPNKPGGQEFHTYEGRGKTPGERKTHAMRQHAQKHGITEQVVHSANPRVKGSSGPSDEVLARTLKEKRDASVHSWVDPERKYRTEGGYGDSVKQPSLEHLASLQDRYAKEAREAGNHERAAHHESRAAEYRSAKKSMAHYAQNEEMDMLESTPELREQIKMLIAQEDPMAKGLYAFEPGYGKQGVNKIPDDYLAAYLDAFIEEAFEHEKRERCHDENAAIMGISQPNGANGGIGGDEADWWAQWVMNELVIYCGKNENLMRACSKTNCTKTFVASRLRAMGLCKPAFNGGEINGDFMEGYQFSEQQTAAGIGKSLTVDQGAFPSEEEMRKSIERTLSIQAEGEPMVKLEDDRINPVEMLGNMHRARFTLMEDVYGLDLGMKTKR